MNRLSTLVPVSCLICGCRREPELFPDKVDAIWRGRPVCASCRNSFALLDSPNRCCRCSAPLPLHLGECERCRRTEYFFTGEVAVCDYRGTAGALIRSYKFRGNQTLGPVLAGFMAASVPIQWRQGRVVVPVPGRRSTLRRRGFDAVGILSAEIARSLGLTLLPALVHRGGGEQKALTYEGRMANVAGSFALRRGVSVPHAPILLVDDVFTTGATTSECARLLLDAGVSAVACLTFAMEL